MFFNCWKTTCHSFWIKSNFFCLQVTTILKTSIFILRLLRNVYFNLQKSFHLHTCARQCNWTATTIVWSSDLCIHKNLKFWCHTNSNLEIRSFLSVVLRGNKWWMVWPGGNVVVVATSSIRHVICNETKQVSFAFSWRQKIN